MTDKYCVIGNPIAHSRSPDIHAAFALQTGQDLVYERCLAPLDGFAGTVRSLIAQGYRGANVTVPFKLEAASIATRLEERARLAGAVTPCASRAARSSATTPTAPGWSRTSSAMPASRSPANACCCWARAARRAAWSCRSCARPRRGS